MSDTIKAIRALQTKCSDDLNKLMPGYGHIFYDPNTKRAHLVSGDSDTNEDVNAWIAALKKITGVNEVTCDAEHCPEEMADKVRIPPIGKAVYSEQAEHPIFAKITEGTVTAADFNQLIQEATPAGMQDRIQRRTRQEVTDGHVDDQGHQQLDMPVFADRVQPKRERAGRTQMHGRGKAAHRRSARTQTRTMRKSLGLESLVTTVPPRFTESAKFIVENIGKPRAEFESNLSKINRNTLRALANKLLSMPGIDRDWLQQFAS